MVDSWKETEERTLVKTRVFELTERRGVNPRTGEEVPVWVLDAADWVNVIPLDSEGRVIIVRQYRHGTRSVTVEVPGGVVERGEEPEAGARRELLEETGYEAGSMELLGVVHPNPAIQTNATYTYLAEGCRKVADLDLDQAEDIDVDAVELSEVERMIRAGEITHSLVVAAFYWLDQRRGLSAKVEEVLEELSSGQTDKVAALAKRINSRLTPEDLVNPQDFSELAGDPDWNYQDGLLAGIESVRSALRRVLRGMC
mgnify:CR=1 FL=1